MMKPLKIYWPYLLTIDLTIQYIDYYLQLLNH